MHLRCSGALPGYLLALKAEHMRLSTLMSSCYMLTVEVPPTCCAVVRRYLSQKGYPLTVVTPSNKVPDILQFINDLGAAFDQVVLLGYPPFIKGVIDAGEYPACALLTAFEPWVSSYSFTEARLYCPPGCGWLICCKIVTVVVLDVLWHAVGSIDNLQQHGNHYDAGGPCVATWVSPTWLSGALCKYDKSIAGYCPVDLTLGWLPSWIGPPSLSRWC